jgi:glucose/arabinose dehydrogenase
MVMLKDPRIAAAAGIAGLALAIVALLALAPWSSGGSSSRVLHQGDANCDQLIDARDALAVLHLAANVPPFAPCAAESGNVNCDRAVNATDAIDIMAYTVGLPTRAAAANTVAGETCPPIGDSLTSPTPTASPTPTTTTHSPSPSVTPTPTPSHSVTARPPLSPSPQPTITPTPGECAGPGGGASLPSAPPPTSPPSAQAYNATQVLSATYLGSPADGAIEFALIPGRPNEAVIAVQSGYIYHVMLDGSGEPSLWGDVHTLVTHDPGDEQGLLSLAFSPNYQQDCRVYLYYTPGSPQPTVLARFHATPEGGLDANSEEILIRVQEFAPNHNGSHIVFDSSGYLYFSVGDGGGGGDPHRRGQALDTLLGKISRIDVSGASGYAIPPSNPYAGGGAPCPTPRSDVDPTPAPGDDTTPCSEIFAYGFRNPFRFTIDPVSGQLWAGDVGQANWEEVDHVISGGNYGWSCYEGLVPYDNYNDPVNDCGNKTFQAPRAVYDHSDGNQAVTGGVIYRGAAMPELYGYYVYADFYSGNVWAVNPNDGSPAVQLISHLGHNISDFVLAANGEVYLMTYSDGLYQLSR